MKKMIGYIFYGWAILCTSIVTGFLFSVILTGGYIKFAFIDWHTIGIIRWLLLN